MLPSNKILYVYIVILNLFLLEHSGTLYTLYCFHMTQLSYPFNLLWLYLWLSVNFTDTAKSFYKNEMLPPFHSLSLTNNSCKGNLHG